MARRRSNGQLGCAGVNKSQGAKEQGRHSIEANDSNQLFENLVKPVSMSLVGNILIEMGCLIGRREDKDKSEFSNILIVKDKMSILFTRVISRRLVR